MAEPLCSPWRVHERVSDRRQKRSWHGADHRVGTMPDFTPVPLLHALFLALYPAVPRSWQINLSFFRRFDMACISVETRSRRTSYVLLNESTQLWCLPVFRQNRRNVTNCLTSRRWQSEMERCDSAQLSRVRARFCIIARRFHARVRNRTLIRVPSDRADRGLAGAQGNE